MNSTSEPKKYSGKSKVTNLASLVDYETGSIASKTIIEKQTGSAAIFAFDKFQEIVHHVVPYDTLFYVLEGEAQVTVNDEPSKVKEGEMIVFPANKPHAIDAKSRFKALLVTFKE